MRHFTVRLPTTNYIKKYLAKHWGDPIPINNLNPVGVMIIALLQKKSVTKMNILKKDTRFQKLTTHILAVGAFSIKDHYGIHLDEDAVIQINRFFENSFEETLYQFVRYHLIDDSRFPGYDNALYKFADYYGIEIDEDISFDGLKKMEYRFRKKFEKKFPSFIPEDRYLSAQLELFDTE